MKALAIVCVLARLASADDHPYLLELGRLDMVERAAKLTAVGDAALAAGDTERAIRAHAIACYYGALSSYDPELRHPACVRTRELLRGHPLPDAEVVLLGAEGTIAAWTLDVPRAVDRLQRAAVVGAKLDLDRPEAVPLLRAHFTLGAILGEGGRFDQALAEIAFTRTHAQAMHADELVAWTDVWLCRTRDLLGDIEAALDHCKRADAYLTRDSDRFLEMNLRWQQGQVEFSRGHHEAALARYRESYELAKSRGGELLRGGMMLNIGASLVELGNIEQGRRWFAGMESAIARGELPAPYAGQVAEQQGELAIRANDLPEAVRRFETASKSPMHWLTIRALGRLAWTKTRAGDPAGARATHEEAIRRIESERVSIDGSLQRTLFMAIHAAPYRELAALVAGEPGGAAHALEIAEAGRARGLLDALAAATTTAASGGNGGNDGNHQTPPHPHTEAEIRAALAPDQVLIEYLTADARTLALVVTRETTRVVELPAAGTADQLAARVTLFRKRLETAATEADVAPITGALYRDVVEPALLGATATTVLIAADGPLHELPFEAVVPDRLAIARVPSGSMLGRRTPRTASGIVAAAPPDTAKLGELFAATAEVERLRERYAGVEVIAGPAASLAALRDKTAGKAVFHFAGHAVLDPALPLRSALVVAPAGDHDGWWRAADIYAHPLALDLVVLSACGTARGAPGGGEGAASLSRAFLHAGARATIATSWDVEDDASARFTDTLYEHLAAGEPIAVALAGTRHELREVAPPRAWAGYALTGDPQLTVAMSSIERPANRTWVWLLGGGALLIAGLLVWRIRRA